MKSSSHSRWSGSPEPDGEKEEGQDAEPRAEPTEEVAVGDAVDAEEEEDADRPEDEVRDPGSEPRIHRTPAAEGLRPPEDPLEDGDEDEPDDDPHMRG